MYYPYFRARQFELIALRELADEDTLQDRVIPIFEPVKRPSITLILRLKIFQIRIKKHTS